ncbi:putative protein FAM47D [Chionomys nivalis]|uniref:putative protein FAM47D n=1 Tax=Chionomys nivalis TaxID=269649 RepID=UPI002593338E|nr:putative protein FAM47D [Chionomys nivalis]
MGDQRLPENQSGQVPRYKHVLKHKKEQMTFPPFIEGHHRLFSQAKLEDFTRDYESREEILSGTIQGTFLPRISDEAPNNATNKSQRKLAQDLGLIYSMSVDQQGSRRNQHKLDHLSQMEDDVENHFINLLQIPKRDWNLNKTPHLENQRNSNKNSKHGKYLHGNFNQETPEKFQSCQKNFLPGNTSTNQNLLDSLNNRYTQRGGDDIYELDDTLEKLDVVQQFTMDNVYQPTCEESSDKNICPLPSKLKYFRGLSKEKVIRFSKEAKIFEMKLQKSHDCCTSTKDQLKYGLSCQKPKQLKALPSKEPINDHKGFLEVQGRSFCKPDVLENLYGTIAFKDFIVHKGYDMPIILKKFFMKKGWNYNSVNTPIPSILKNHELIMQKQDDEDEEEWEGN